MVGSNVSRSSGVVQRAEDEISKPFIAVGVLAIAMWVEEIVDLFPHTDFDSWGIRPRTARGLLGIFLAPFLHAGFGHLVANTVPFVLLGVVIAAGGIDTFFEATLSIAVVSGLGVWVFGQSHSVHIGASGVVFGYVTFLVSRGIFARRFGWIVIGAFVVAVYGGIVWGLFPKPGISWQGHLFGAIGGVFIAYALYGTDDEPSPRRLGP
jgi:membrane associated rhomboid family serine protease